jgi:AraC-like DNA-binding protein
MMRRYIENTPGHGSPQMLQLYDENGIAYRFRCRHATIDEIRRFSVGRPEPTHMHSDVYHVVLYTQGDNRFQFGGRLVPLKRGTLVVTAPGEPHSFGICLPGDAVYSELTFSLESDTGRFLTIPFPEFASRYVGGPLPAMTFPILLGEGKVETFRILFSRLLDGFEQKVVERRNLEVHEAAIRLLVEAIRCLFGDSDPVEVTESDTLAQAKDFIDRHYRNPIQIKEIAAVACYSEGHFLREFQRRYGTSPIAYRKSLRIRAARTLLDTTGFRVQEIVEQIGYHDVHQFTKAFRKEVGQSPVQYRRRHQREKNNKA